MKQKDFSLSLMSKLHSAYERGRSLSKSRDHITFTQP